jgi:hypothetical protein
MIPSVCRGRPWPGGEFESWPEGWVRAMRYARIAGIWVEIAGNTSLKDLLAGWYGKERGIF